MALISKSRGWTVESTESNAELGGAYYKPVLEDPADDLRWYARYFVCAEHCNFVGKAEGDKGGPFCVSVVREMENFVPRVRGIVWTVQRKQHVLFEVKKHRDWKKSLVEVLKAAGAHELAKGVKKMVVANSPTMRSELIKLEEFQTPTAYKIGVLYVRAGQSREEEFFANDCEPEVDTAFDEFLSLIGTRIALQGWNGYRAGLDVEEGGTGETSVFTSLRGCDVMFHVCTMLPHDTTGQEVQRKRQIGNDVTAIVFCDEGAEFNPASIDSQFLHVYAVVRPLAGKPGMYELSYCRQDSVRPFGPLLTSPRFTANAAFVDFLLTKLINGERACLKSAPIFVHTYQRTVRTTLNTLYEGLKNDKSPDSLAPLADGKLVPTSSSTALAVDTGPRAGVPQLETSDSIFVCTELAAALKIEILSLVVWRESFVYATVDGLFVCEAGKGLANPRLVCKTGLSKLVLREDIGILIGEPCKKGKLRFWLLAQLENYDPKTVVENKVANTKGLHAWEVARPMSSTYLAVGKGKSILLYKWAGRVFEHQHTYALPARVKVMRFLGTSLIIAFHQEFDELELETSEVRELFVPDRSVDPLDVLFLGFKQGDMVSPLQELLLCYDNKGVVVNRFGELSRAFDLRWTAAPSAFAYLDPYVLAVTSKYVEVRTTLNGTLIQRLTLSEPISLLSFGSSLYVSTGVRGADGIMSIFEIKPNLAVNLLELDAISNALRDRVRSPQFKVTRRPTVGSSSSRNATPASSTLAAAAAAAVASPGAATVDDGKVEALLAAIDSGKASDVTEIVEASADAVSEQSSDGEASSEGGADDADDAHGGEPESTISDAGVDPAAYLMQSSSSDSDSGFEDTQVVAMEAAGPSGSDAADGANRERAAGSGSAIPTEVANAVAALHTALEAARPRFMHTAEAGMLDAAVVALQATNSCKGPGWGPEYLREVFPPLVHILGLFIDFEAAVEMHEQSLATATACKLYEPLAGALDVVREALPSVEATVAGVRQALMAVRRFKQFLDSLIAYAADDVPEATLGSVSNLSDGVADAAASLVVATKGFSQAADNADASSEVRTACELLTSHARRLYKAARVVTVHHDASHIISYATEKLDGNDKSDVSTINAVIDVCRALEATINE
ncbi:uncharacterized protein AMSG_03132 [Thecamonas trahens ATCC 50062]|uniref:Uncharacterized protein n=1 Tax=Thecamonas trahens ATCC 50062 TaxID=461836 RepID=A0A0L0D3D7_THETB|nr:hypothetical protein AMSG_03132 [Thecamonas trahens ATCC 50062]KNC46695.1 hypothetical protein AMSG_03132 [Thecamonas trahens ATCC 50062]|eukprot:XP_013760463.1 hypothetical protein AMSG_03132 [Thecamonas trahens ATCC 50062]